MLNLVYTCAPKSAPGAEDGAKPCFGCCAWLQVGGSLGTYMF